MPDLSAIREGIKTRLETISGWQVSAYIQSSPTPPCAMVYADETLFDVAVDTDAIPMVVRVIVPFATDIGAQVSLDEYRARSGDKSVKAALEAEPTLGGAIDDLRVESISADTVYGGLGGQTLGIGCEFRVYVIATG